MKNRTNIAPWLILVAICAGALGAPWILPWAEAQRTGYVEKTASGAFANQLAPNPAAGLVLTPVGTDTSKVQWGTSGATLPPGTDGQVLGVRTVATSSIGTATVTSTATRTATSNYYSESFESGAGSWSSTTAPTTPTIVTDATAPDGTHAMQVTRTGSGGDYFSPTFSVAGGVDYCLDFWVRWNNTGGWPYVGIQPSTAAGPTWVAGGAYRDAGAPAITASTSWQHLQYTYAMPAGATTAQFTVELLAFELGGSATPHEAYFDFVRAAPCAPETYVATSTATAVTTASATAWDAVNGAIAAGSNVAITKGAGTETFATVDLKDQPKIHATGLVKGNGTLGGTLNYLIKRTSTGWDSTIGIVESSSGLTLTEPYVLHRSDGSIWSKIENASNSQYDAPSILCDRKRGTLASPADAQAGDYICRVGFSGRGYQTAELLSVVDSVNGSNLVGSLCLSVSDGTVSYANKTVWCARSSGLTISTPLVLSGLTSKGAGKVLYDTDGNGTIGEKTLTASDVGAEPALPAASQGKILGFATVTTAGTSTATKWDAINGAIAVGTNLRMTKGTGTDTSTSATMQELPKINLDGFSGTTGVLSKKTSDGWGDSCVSESTNSLDSSKTIRATGASVPSTGAGVEMLYSSGTEIGYLISIDRGAATHKPLNISGSSLRFVVNNTVTMLAPETAGEAGQFLAKGTGNSSVWSTITIPAPDDHAVSVFEGSTPGYLNEVLYSPSGGGINLIVDAESIPQRYGISAAFGSTSGTICQGNDSRLSNARTPTAHASTHAAGGSDVVTGVLVQRQTYTNSSTYTPGSAGEWGKVNEQTFTATGTHFRVSAHARFMASATGASYSHLCGLAILANSGSTASTPQGPQDWTQAIANHMFSNTTISGWTDVATQTFIGTASTEADFTLSEGTVAVAAAVYQYGSHSSSCTVPAGEMVVYVDVFK